MVDTPQKFIKSVMDTDDEFVQGVDTSTMLSVGLIPNPLNIFDPIFNPIIDKLKRNMHEIFTEAKEIVDNPPECIDKDDVYVIKNYVMNSEIPFVKSAIARTAMKRYVHVPDGVDELRLKLAAIPCCHGMD